MSASMVQRVVRLLPVMLVALIVCSDAKPALAATCFSDLRDCYGRAAGRDGGIWDMWAYGLDCELTFTDCTRRAIVGR
jgi:hypothetical protein